MVNPNPVLYKIIQAGLSARSFAIVYDCPQASLRNCVYGYTDIVPDTVKKSLVKAGFTIDNIDAEYKAWLKTKVKKELEDCENV